MATTGMYLGYDGPYPRIPDTLFPGETASARVLTFGGSLQISQPAYAQIPFSGQAGPDPHPVAGFWSLPLSPQTLTGSISGSLGFGTPDGSVAVGLYVVAFDGLIRGTLIPRTELVPISSTLSVPASTPLEDFSTIGGDRLLYVVSAADTSSATLTFGAGTSWLVFDTTVYFDPEEDWPISAGAAWEGDFAGASNLTGVSLTPPQISVWTR